MLNVVPTFATGAAPKFGVLRMVAGRDCPVVVPTTEALGAATLIRFEVVDRRGESTARASMPGTWASGAVSCVFARTTTTTLAAGAARTMWWRLDVELAGVLSTLAHGPCEITLP